MGNSGSAHSTLPNSDEHNNYRHPPSQWSQSIPRDSTNRHSHQIKVLPELKGGPRLRPTNNGNILHGGGTLSGRRDLVLHNGVFRTRSTSSTRSPEPSEQNVRVPHPHQLMQRSQTQLNIIRHQPGLIKLPEKNPIKRFGSEPDLRGSDGDEQINNQNGDVNGSTDRNNLPKAKLIRNKKKKAAPLPPIQAKVNQASTDRKSLNYDPSRFGWKKQDENAFPLNKENAEEKEAPKKLRLFKTKAETQKVNEVTVIPKEMEKQSSTKNHLTRYSNAERQSFNSLPYHHDVRNNEFDRLSDHHEESVPSLPQLFRREKSFDLSLLMAQKQSNFGNSLLGIKELHVKSPNDVNNQRSLPAAGRMSSVESKLRSRKFSQPVTSSTNSGNNAETDFKKELLAATRRRSQNIVLKTKDDSAVLTDLMLLSKNCDELEKSSGNKIFERSENKPVDDLKLEERRSIRKHPDKDSSEERHPQQQSSDSATKTFYFGMSKDQSMLLNDELPVVHKTQRDLLSATNHFSESESETDSSLSSALIDHFPMHLIQTIDEHLNDPDSNPNGIQVHVRPTLPRRQYEVPRFSPAAAWKNLTLADCDTVASPDEIANVCEKQNFSSYSANDIDETLNQQLIESRIECVYRDPVPGFLDNKSGDSGISGDDAGMLQERVESPAVQNDDKIGPFLSPWTPLQDLGEESSSDDAEVANSKEELTKLVNRGHVFSLSLPRESHLLGYGGENLQLTDAKTFNSLQKLKRTVSSAFGGSNDSREQSKPTIYHNENWMLSRSAPNSIDNNLFSPVLHAPSDCEDDNEDFMAYEEDRNVHNAEGIEGKIQNKEYRSYSRRPRQQTQTEHSKILPPSFNYLTGGKHLMYLPNQDNAMTVYDEPDNVTVNVVNDRSYKAELNGAENRYSKFVCNDQQPNERENLQDPPEFALNLNVSLNDVIANGRQIRLSNISSSHFRRTYKWTALSHHSLHSK